MRGMRRECKLLKFNNGGERNGPSTLQRKKKGPYIGLPLNMTVTWILPW
jgi:hypothetical protein